MRGDGRCMIQGVVEKNASADSCRSEAASSIGTAMAPDLLKLQLLRGSRLLGVVLRAKKLNIAGRIFQKRPDSR